jgi:rod shape-determining protein MreC
MLALTVLLAILDLSGSGVPDRLRAVGATVVGPVQRFLVGRDDSDASSVRRDNERLVAQLRLRESDLAQAGAVAQVLASPSTAGARVVPARVVGYRSAGTTTLGGRTVTLDVGHRDGVSPGLTVVAAAGLVGRVMSVAPWTCDVQVLGGADATVAVRVDGSVAPGSGAPGSGALGSVGAAAPVDTPARAPGDLSLTLVDQGAVKVGDQVSTLGSVDERPYVPHVLVGTVIAVDPPRGRLTRTAVVHPAIDPATLDVVAVLMSAPRERPRAPVTGGG